MMNGWNERRPRAKRRLSIVTSFLLFMLSLLPASAAGAAEETEPVRLPIVMYHQLTKTPARVNTYTLTLEQFENDLRYLRDEGYESVTLRELLAWSDGLGALPAKPVMITFDDGFETTGVWAPPLLEQYGFTAIMAVVGSVAQLYTDTPDHNLAYSHLGWEAVAELSQVGVLEVQSHTWNMHIIGARRGCSKLFGGEGGAAYRAALTADLARFEEEAARNGVKTVPGIAFPYGYYCDDTLGVIRDLGYRAAFTCAARVNTLTGDQDELMELCRFNRPPGKTSAQFFAAWDK